MYLKGAKLEGDEYQFQENTSVGKNTWRQRAIADANQVVVDDKLAIRLPASVDFYSPSYIGVPVWRGEPGGGYGWYESSCQRGDRSKYSGMMVNPYVDWQVTDDWLLKLGGAFMYSDASQTTREPYTESGAGLQHYFETGRWLDETQKYQTTGFSESDWFSRNFNLYARSVYAKEDLPWGFRNTFLVQPDFYYRDSSGGFGTPTSRYGVSAQDEIGWGWVSLLGGLRYDYFVENDSLVTTTSRGVTTTTRYDEARAYAFSPRGGLTIQPLDWLVFFGNLSQTQTPTLGYVSADGSRPTDPWKATQYEGGLRLRPVEKLWFSTSYYHIDQENMPMLDSDNYYYFDGHNSSDGVELSLSGDITENWTAMAMYAYNFYVNHDATGKASEFERTPRNTVSFNTSYRLNGFDLIEDIVVGMGYRYRSMSYATMRGSYVDENLYFNSSHVFDINMSIPFSKVGLNDKWFLTLGVRNLFDERYFENSRHYYECFVGEPRTFEIGIRGSF